MYYTVDMTRFHRIAIWTLLCLLCLGLGCQPGETAAAAALAAVLGPAAVPTPAPSPTPAGTPTSDAALTPAQIPVPTRCPYAPEAAPKRDGDRWLTVYLGSQSVVCFVAKGADWEVERIMICSAADKKHTTPLGSHYIYSKYKYKALSRMNGILVYGQYACRFRGHYLFHTVPIGGARRNVQKNGKKQMLIEEYEKLGTPASHGCVRLLVGDAYWIYTNCPKGTTVLVTADAGPTPPPVPALIYEAPYMNADHTLGWDPTDPDAENPYREIYPEWFTE